ncbi:MAG: hypothetical protein KF708_19375 [Pirellulales bacterium]|nr:hypothetical protein [Pirellulales bacterium]
MPRRNDVQALLRRVIRASVVLGGLCMASAARGEDIIHVAAEPGSDQVTRLTGEVVDFTGRELTLARPGGQEQRYPTTRIVEVETARSAEQLAAIQLAAQHKYDEALRQFEAAAGVESRPWVRREILAEMVWCLRELDQPARAGDAFLALVQSDPETQYFSCLPLAWVTAQLSPDLERRAKAWIAHGNSIATLLGASYLLSTPERAAATERLKQLMLDRDTRVRAMARAQLWRTDSANINEEELAARLGEVEKMPPGMRGGPALVLGQALAARQDHDRAARWLLRLPLVDGRPRRLAARALHEAAESLEQVGRPAEARLLYDELVEKYGATPEGRDAHTRLEARATQASKTGSLQQPAP